MQGTQIACRSIRIDGVRDSSVSNQIIGDVDVAARGFGIGTKVLRLIHKRLGNLALDSRQADIEARAQEIAAVHQMQIYARFREGFDTVDLKAAKLLLSDIG